MPQFKNMFGGDMKIVITDTFVKSLKRLAWRQSLPIIILDTIRYNIPTFFKNIYRFRKELYDFHWWDYRFNLNLFKKSLEITAYSIEKHGQEIDEHRLKKVSDIKIVCQILQDFDDGKRLSYAEKELGLTYTENNGGLFEPVKDKEAAKINYKISKKANELEQERWKKVWQIISDEMQGWWD